MNLTKRALFVSTFAMAVTTATEASAVRELPDYIRIIAHFTSDFSPHEIDLRIHDMKDDACIQIRYDMLDDIYASYGIDPYVLSGVIESQHPELEVTFVEEDGVNEEVRYWIRRRENTHFKVIRYDGPISGTYTLKLPAHSKYYHVDNDVLLCNIPMPNGRSMTVQFFNGRAQFLEETLNSYGVDGHYIAGSIEQTWPRYKCISTETWVTLFEKRP